MTKPRYPQGCAARSQEQERAVPVPGNEDNFFVVDFNNGNVNNNHRDNHHWVRPVRSLSPSGESHGVAAEAAVSRRSMFKAWKRARRRKKPSRNQAKFEARWLDSIDALAASVADGTWQPSPTVCFITQRPKARQIHAPGFGDRVGHHWAIPILEEKLDPTFIDAAFANRKGKGTHAAVQYVWRMARQVHSGQGGGWYLQLDIKNFFNSIPRRKLWKILKRAMERHDVPEPVRHFMHALLRRSPLDYGVIHRSTPEERARVPEHKRLESAPPGCGITIGNFSSQFVSGVLMNPFDQWVKHVLGAERYARYVDDFILIHRSREQLEAWLVEIRDWLRENLELELKADIKLRPLTAGIDFLGYVIYPTHLRVRRRVIGHAREALSRWERRHVRNGRIEATPAELRAIQSTWASYQGHFRHASTWHLQQDFHRRYPWLQAVTVKRRFPADFEDQPLELAYA